MFASDTLVRVAFSALKDVMLRVPVEGLNVSLVDETLVGRLPVVVVNQAGYMVALVVVSSVIPTVVALPALPDTVV